MATKIQQCLLKNKTYLFSCYSARTPVFLNILPRRAIPVKQYATSPESTRSTQEDKKESDKELFVSLSEHDHDDSDSQEYEAQIMAKRDISRLKRHLKHKMYHHEQLPEFENRNWKPTRMYKREVYGKMGKNSGYDPSLFYPFEDELKEMLEERELFEPSLEQLIASAQAKVDAAEKEKSEKEKLVLKQMAKMPKLIEEFRAKVQKQQAEEQKKADHIKELLKEAREYYGYHVDHKDPRFEKMVADKELQAQEEKKAKRKKERQEAALQQMLATQEKAKREREEATKRELERQEREQKEQQTGSQ